MLAILPTESTEIISISCKTKARTNTSSGYIFPIGVYFDWTDTRTESCRWIAPVPIITYLYAGLIDLTTEVSPWTSLGTRMKKHICVYSLENWTVCRTYSSRIIGKRPIWTDFNALIGYIIGPWALTALSLATSSTRVAVLIICGCICTSVHALTTIRVGEIVGSSTVEYTNITIGIIIRTWRTSCHTFIRRIISIWIIWSTALRHTLKSIIESKWIFTVKQALPGTIVCIVIDCTIGA
jgi:hypothetical protein